MQLDFVILGLLALRRFSGYDLRRWMDGKGQYLGYGVQLPQIYRRLAKLVERGWAEYDIDPRDGAPDAKVYRLTEDGRAALLDWARSPYEPSTRPHDPDFKIRFIFAGQLDREIAIDLVRTELDYRLRQTAGKNGALELPDYEAQIPEIDPAWAREVHLLAHEDGYASSRSYIVWLQLTLQRLESGR
ncbi:PadR family transcriptional regulator [Streptomyces sp. NPDC048473]|uniref:PadR family transcriptional regulator n=1 Tax=unclassified Streptomyces TaxID=2593676 RepID=UPI00371FEC5F